MFKPFIADGLSASLLLLSACSAPGPKFRNVSSYFEGLAAIQHSGGKWGFVNGRQEWVIQPRFEKVKSFQAGRAAVRQNGKWGFINKRGDWLCPCPKISYSITESMNRLDEPEPQASCLQTASSYCKPAPNSVVYGYPKAAGRPVSPLTWHRVANALPLQALLRNA